MCDVSSILFSRIKLHILHLAGYLPIRRSAGKTGFDEDFDRLVLILLFEVEAAALAKESSRAVVKAPSLLE